MQAQTANTAAQKPQTGTQTQIFSDTNANKRKRADESNTSEKKQRKENWEMDDDHSFLQLVQKYKFSWDQVKNDLLKHQHRRTDDTEVTLEKHWKNLAGPKSKYAEGKEYEGTPFKTPRRKMSDIELEQAEASHEESVCSFSLLGRFSFFVFLSIFFSFFFLSFFLIFFSHLFSYLFLAISKEKTIPRMPRAHCQN